MSYIGVALIKPSFTHLLINGVLFRVEKLAKWFKLGALKLSNEMGVYITLFSEVPYKRRVFLAIAPKLLKI